MKKVLISNNANSPLGSNCGVKRRGIAPLANMSEFAGLKNVGLKSEVLNPTIFNKTGESFQFGVTIIGLAVLVSMAAFISEDYKVGMAGAPLSSANTVEHDIFYPEFDYFNSISSLSQGTYYIDEEGYIYWADDASKPIVGKIKNLDGDYKKRLIYVDKEGNLGFII